MYRDVVFTDKPPKFFRYSSNIWNDNVVQFVVLLLSAVKVLLPDVIVVLKA